MSHITSYFNNSYDQSKREMSFFKITDPRMTETVIFYIEKNYCKSEFQLHRTLHKMPTDTRTVKTTTNCLYASTDRIYIILIFSVLLTLT